MMANIMTMELAITVLVTVILTVPIFALIVRWFNVRLTDSFFAGTLLIAYLGGEFWFRGIDEWWPRDTSRKLALCAVGALGVSLIDWTSRSLRHGLATFFTLGARAVVCLAGMGLVIRSAAQDSDERLIIWICRLAFFATWVGVQWVMFDRTPTKFAPKTSLTLGLVVVGSAGVFAMSGSRELALLEAIVGACLVAGARTTWRAPVPSAVRGLFGGALLLHSSLVAFGFWFGQLSLMELITLTVWPMIAGLAVHSATKLPRTFTTLPIIGALLIPASAIALNADFCERVAPSKAGNDDCLLFVALEGDRQVAVFRSDQCFGRLTRLPAAPTLGAPRFLTVDGQHRRLFVTMKDPDCLASYQIHPTTGQLRQLSILKYPHQAYLSVAADGKHLFCADYQRGEITVFEISAEGRLFDPALQVIQTVPRIHAIVIDSSCRFVFAPHTVPNLIYQFVFDGTSGHLTPNLIPWHKTPHQTGPRHMTLHPKKNTAYVVNEFQPSVTAYHVDENTGSLTPSQTISTLPADYKGPNACSEIHLHPSGSFLYAANRFHDSLACYRIDAKSGRLELIDVVKTERMPWTFTLSPSGEYLFLAGREWGRIVTYRIIPESGRLLRMSTDDGGRDPLSTATIRIGS